MAQQRPNRLVQMKTQEEIIQRKRKEILDRQRQHEIVKQYSAAAGIDNSTSSKDAHDPKSIKNTFDNDGSFLENFKKISEQVQQKLKPSTQQPTPQVTEIPKTSPPAAGGGAVVASGSNCSLPPTQPQPFIPPFGLTAYPTSQQQQQHQPSQSPPSQVFFNPHVPPPNAVHGPPTIGNPRIAVPITSPPPPPPSSAATEDVLDIRNAKVFSDIEDKLPTTLSELIDLVATIGDIYEEKICLRKNDVPSSFWFLFDHSSEEYKRYRAMVTERRKPVDEDQFDPVKHFEENESVLIEPAVVVVETPKKMVYASIDKSDSSDSDTEYMREAKERNLKSLKYKALHPNNARKKNADSTDSDEDTDRTGEDSLGSIKRDHSQMLESDEPTTSNQPRVKKSRWGEKVVVVAPTTPAVPAIAPRLSAIKRTDDALLKYAIENFGSVNLSEEDWKKAEEAYKVNLLYQDMLRKRQEIDQLARCGKFKYEYDSDEDLNGGTWEHKLRMQEMEATQLWASALNKQAEGKHHIGDFLPPEELKKFMEKYEAQKSQKPADLSDYKEFKLKEDNVGFQMLQKLGWKEGTGLGAGGSGILEPVNKASQRAQNQGLGVEQADVPQPQNDDEYDAYRKRMMLAYRFRPNPLNNPRRAYY